MDMRTVMIDTNVLLDYMNVGNNDQHCKDASELMKLLAENSYNVVVIPAILKDFEYVFAMHLKRSMREASGALSQEDAIKASCVAQAAVETLLGFVIVASEGLTDCHMAQVLFKQHADYEDCLIAAVAMRLDVDLLVTSDVEFMKHCPVACLSPCEALALAKSWSSAE